MRRAAIVALLLLLPVPARSEPPRIELVTMGPGDDAFSRFGHAALCVSQRCFNYGTTDFSTPGPLTWAFLRGRARFWLSTAPRAVMLRAYEEDDRTVWSQTLPLEEDAARELARRVAGDLAPGKRTYVYHHFADNCATRLRDHIDAVTGGALRRSERRPHARSYREIVRAGFAGDATLLVLSETIPGRALDRRPSRWDAMFLPDVLREEVTARLHAEPRRIGARRAPLHGGDARTGRLALALAALGLGAAVFALVRARRPRLAAALASVPLGVAGVVITGLAVVSTLPELRANELLVVFWPADLALAALPLPFMRRYVIARLAVLGLAALAAAVGLFTQPLAAPLLLATLPLAALTRGPSPMRP